MATAAERALLHHMADVWVASRSPEATFRGSWFSHVAEAARAWRAEIMARAAKPPCDPPPLFMWLGVETVEEARNAG